MESGRDDRQIDLAGASSEWRHRRAEKHGYTGREILDAVHLNRGNTVKRARDNTKSFCSVVCVVCLIFGIRA